MKSESLFVLVLFAVCSVANLAAVQSGSRKAECFTKPLLMPLLLLFYLLTAQKPELPIAAALGFGFLGDTFLLGSRVFFACGLFSFLLGHICYLTAFVSPLNLSALSPLFVICAAALCLLFSIPVGLRLFPFIERKLRPAAMLYLVALLGMSFSALLRCSYTGGRCFWFPFLGSLFFVASDTMLAFRVFREKGGRFSQMEGMAAYLLAQTMIVFGFLP